MSAPPRNWTADDDDLMRRQSVGEFSMHKLERELLAGREAILNRMKELGFKPIIMKRRGLRGPSLGVRLRDFMPEPTPSDILNFAPHVGKDKLLLELHKHHDDRRYEEMNLPMKRRAR